MDLLTNIAIYKIRKLPNEPLEEAGGLWPHISGDPLPQIDYLDSPLITIIIK